MGIVVYLPPVNTAYELGRKHGVEGKKGISKTPDYLIGLVEGLLMRRIARKTERMIEGERRDAPER